MIERIVSPEGEYDVIQRGTAPPPELKDGYWERVRRALQDVFGADPGLAEPVRRNLEQQPADTQTAFYHADPFEVAADLAGRRGQIISADEKARYLDAEQRSDRPSPEQLRQAHPEQPIDPAQPTGSRP